MKYYSGTLLVSLLLAAIIGCNQQPSVVAPGPSITVTPEAGTFGLNHLKGLSKQSSTADIKDASNAKFNLGKIKGSTNFYFLLYNIGATPITQVTLSIANNHFSVFPATIDSLLPGNDVGMLPIVKVSAFHGTPLDGVGNRPLLDKGTNSLTLTISGHSTTADNRDTLIELDAQMSLEALVVDYTLTAPSNNLSFRGAKPSHFFGDHPTLSKVTTFAEYHASCIIDSIVSFKNSGSIDLHIEVYHPDRNNSDGASLFMDTIISIAGSMDIPIAYPEYVQTDLPVVIKVYGQNTTADPDSIPVNSDGNYYTTIYPTDSECEDVALGAKFSDFVESNKSSDCKYFIGLIDDSKLLHATKCGDQTVTCTYKLYNFASDELLCTIISLDGEVTEECAAGPSSDLLKQIRTILESDQPDLKKLDPSFGVVNRASATWLR